MSISILTLCHFFSNSSNSHESGIEFADEDSAGADDDFEEPMTALGTAKALYPFEGLYFLLLIINHSYRHFLIRRPR